MYKILISLALIVFFVSSCSKNDNFKREVKELNTEVFYGIDSSKSRTNEGLIKLMVQDVNNAFKLGAINEAAADNEVRIYYIFPFGETFFRQQFKDGITKLDLYVCNTIRRSDSLFMKISDVVHSEGKYNYDESLRIDVAIDTLTINDDNEKQDVLDGFATFLIQVKNNSKSKFFLIEKPFSIEGKNEITKYVCNLIRNINKNFSFKFYGSRKEIIDSAFINPYAFVK